MMKKLKFSRSALVFYIMAVITMGICIYTLYNVTVYIQSLVAAGQLAWAANISDIINYYINNAFVYVVYTFIFVGMGYIITLLKNSKKQAIEEVTNDVLDSEVTEILNDETTEVIENEVTEINENTEINTEEEMKI